MKVKVNVTQRDIKAGCKVNATCCPIARAINRLLRGGHSSSVCQFGGHIYETGPVAEIVIPKKAAAFMDAFDKPAPVRPFTFTLDLPAKVLKARKK